MSGTDDRATVKTYVPSYQKDRWVRDAEEFSMSQSEFVRSMVQAGRRQLLEGTPEEPTDPTATPRGSDLENRLYEVVSREEPIGYHDILVELFADELDRAIDASERIEHDRRREAYVTSDG